MKNLIIKALVLYHIICTHFLIEFLEYFLYTRFYETKTLTFCGFKKMHPHDSQSIIRVAYKDVIDKSTIKGNLKECIEESKQVFTKIRKEFLKMVKS